MIIIIWGACYAFVAEHNTRKNFVKIRLVISEQDKVV